MKTSPRFPPGSCCIFRVREAKLGCTQEAHDAEDNEHPPCDVQEAGGDVEAKGKIKNPVAASRNAHSGRTRLQTPDLGSVDPGNRGQCQCIDDNEEVAESNNDVCSGSLHLNHDVGIATHATGDVFAGGENSSNYKVTNSHSHGTVDEKRPSSRPINIEEHNCREDNEQRVLDTRGYKVDVACKTSHHEDVYDVLTIISASATG